MIEPRFFTALRYMAPQAEIAATCTYELLCDSITHYEVDSELVIVDGPEL